MNMGKKSAAPPEPAARKPKHKEPEDSTASTDCAGPAVLFSKEDGDNGFLCQWYRCNFTDPEHDGMIFTSAEQYMMWRKAIVSTATR